MQSYKVESRASKASAANETQSLALRPKLDPTHSSKSRGFAVCARIGVAMLYVACAIAAVAQPPEQSRVHLRSAVGSRSPCTSRVSGYSNQVMTIWP